VPKEELGFLESNLFICPTVFMSDFGGKGVGPCNQCSSVNIHKTSELLRRRQESSNPMKSLLYSLNIVKEKNRTLFIIVVIQTF
jgi:hypothetical protein